MDEVTINSEYMRRIVEKLRAVMGDQGPATSQETSGSLLLQELREEIDALDVDHKHELVALMWIGRGDFQANDWLEALELAEERHEGPTSKYLLSHPMVADELANGLEEIGYSHVLQDGSY